MFDFVKALTWENFYRVNLTCLVAELTPKFKNSERNPQQIFLFLWCMQWKVPPGGDGVGGGVGGGGGQGRESEEHTSEE